MILRQLLRVKTALDRGDDPASRGGVIEEAIHAGSNEVNSTSRRA